LRRGSNELVGAVTGGTFYESVILAVVITIGFDGFVWATTVLKVFDFVELWILDLDTADYSHLPYPLQSIVCPPEEPVLGYHTAGRYVKQNKMILAPPYSSPWACLVRFAIIAGAQGRMIVDCLTFTFSEEHGDRLPSLVKIDPGAVTLETKSGYTEYRSLRGSL
jgi:hypothetical protein